MLGAAGKVLEVSMPVPEQFRGGPLLDINGQLVGMLLVLDRGFKIGIPVASLVSVARTGKVAEFKTQTPENYFETVEGNLFAGRAALALDEQMTARLHIEKMVKLDPSNLAGHLQLAQIYAKQRDYSAAAASYRKVTGLDPTRADAYYGLGTILMKQTQYKDAAEAFEKAFALGYAGPEVQFDLGSRPRGPAGLGQGRGGLREVHRSGPGRDRSAYHRLGICRTNLGRVRQGHRRPARSPEGPAEGPQGPRGPGRGLRQGRPDRERRGRLYRLAEINPAEAKTYYRQYYQMYVAADKHDRAIVPLKKIIELDPKNETNFYYLGMTYFKLQKYDEAIAAFQQSLAIKPDFEYAWYQIGSSYFQAKKYKEAAEAYKKYVEIKPDDPSGWMSIGVSLHPGQELRSGPGAAEEVRRAEARRRGRPGQPGHRLHQPQGQLQRQGDLQQAPDPRSCPGGEAEEVHPMRFGPGGN